MYKDIVISLLGALLLEPVLGSTEVGEQIAIVMGLAAMLFIFCLFCEDQAEKWAKELLGDAYTEELEQKLEELKGGKANENRTVLHGQAVEDGGRIYESGDPEGLVSGEVSV